MEFVIIIAVIAGLILGYFSGIKSKKGPTQKEFDDLKASLQIESISKAKIEEKVFQLEKNIEDIKSEKNIIQSEILKKDACINDFSSKNASLETMIENLKSKLMDIQKLQEDIQALTAVNSQLQTENKNYIERLATQKQEIENIQDKFKNEFEVLANKILEDKSKTFTEQNKNNLDNLLKPLDKEIREFKLKVEETYDKESKQRFLLENELKRLSELNIQMSEDANNLTKALKGESKTQGLWGEYKLEKVLVDSGLEKDKDFKLQQNLTHEDGRSIPDAIIYLPEDRNLIIDSKVSLKAYVKFCNAENDEEKKIYLNEHITSVKNHIKNLAGKNYFMLDGLKTPDYVLMFVNPEPAYILAVANDVDLVSFANENHIQIVSPTSLLSSLRTIASIWRIERQNKNAKNIADYVGKLYDKFYGFVEDLEKIKKSFVGVDKSFDDAFKKLNTGKGNIIGTLEKVKKEGGIKTTKQLEPKLTELGLIELGEDEFSLLPEGEEETQNP